MNTDITFVEVNYLNNKSLQNKIFFDFWSFIYFVLEKKNRKKYELTAQIHCPIKSYEKQASRKQRMFWMYCVLFDLE